MFVRTTLFSSFTSQRSLLFPLQSLLYYAIPYNHHICTITSHSSCFTWLKSSFKSLPCIKMGVTAALSSLSFIVGVIPWSHENLFPKAMKFSLSSPMHFFKSTSGPLSLHSRLLGWTKFVDIITAVHCFLSGSKFPGYCHNFSR